MQRFLVARLIFAIIFFRGCKYWYISRWFISVDGEVLIISSEIIFVATKHTSMVFIVYVGKREYNCNITLSLTNSPKLAWRRWFFLHNYLLLGRNQLFCEKKSTFDELQVKKTSSNQPIFCRLNVLDII